MQRFLYSLLFFSAFPLLNAEEESPQSEEIALAEKYYTDDMEVDPPIDRYLPPVPPLPKLKEIPEELVVNLKDPSFKHGVISTDKGGVISAPNLRIQAQNIEYTNKMENGVRVQKIIASGDLMLEYGSRAFVGEHLEYDFINRTGELTNGKTFVDMWFLGGDKIELKDDGSYYIYNAFVTTCESQENTWEIKANSVSVTKDRLLSAKDIRFQFFKVPLLWLPAFKSNLRAISDPPIRYKVVWDKGIGPRATMRYRFYSLQNFNVFFRLDYRLDRGFGAAIESECFSPDGNTTFVTRNYGANDKTFPNEKGPHRYRLQGLLDHQSKDEKTKVHLTWDKLGDTRMVGDFRSDDFEINTEKRTRLLITHEASRTFLNFSCQPRINRFQSIDQQLPLASIGILPFQIGNSGIISVNYTNAGYLDYVYATDLRKQFRIMGLRSSTKSGRLETMNQLYRPIAMGPVTLTPSVGIIGIFYSNSPFNDAVGQGMASYGFKANTRIWRKFSRARHMIEPYANFQGLTTPFAGINDHYYFDINDGYHQLNQLRVGIRNVLFKPNSQSLLPMFSADLYTNGFFGNKAFGACFPKYYLDFTISRPTFSLKGNFAWNNQQNLWDFTNAIFDWTINEDFAFGLEFRHRSRYDWRKGNHQNFILDVSRPIDELLDSPLSDGRNTLLGKFFVRLAPKWHVQIETRNGWGRKNDPTYNAAKFDLVTMLTCSWRLRLTYERMPNDNRFSSSVFLLK